MFRCEKEYACHGGTLGYYFHDSVETRTPMRFTLFTPSDDKKTGALVVFLSGLTCTEDNFTTKSGAYRKAAALGVSVLAPDTSPRGDDVPDDEAYDLGQGAGFYLDATQEPWAKNFRMESYLIKELIPQCVENFGLDPERQAIMGHSMGGHGALTLYFKYPDMFQSCSAFSPIVAPSQVPWGQKAFTAYLGDDPEVWKLHDASVLVQNSVSANTNASILIDQGLNDDFLENQLKTEIFEQACADAGQKLTARMQEGYDHSYFFIQSFIDDHLEWHVKNLT